MTALLPLFIHGQNAVKNSPYRVEKGVIYSDKGIPELPRWFADGRVAFQFDETGICQIDYHNPNQKTNHQTVFLRQLWDGFRYFLEQDNLTYKPEYVNSQVWPFGIESEWKFGGVILKHRIMVVDEAIIMQVTVPEKAPTNTRFKMEFFEPFGLSRGGAEDFRFHNSDITRKWQKWEFSSVKNILQGGFISYPSEQENNPAKVISRFFCGINADFPIEYSARPLNYKFLLKSPVLEAGKTYSFIINFGNEKIAFLKKNERLAQNLPQTIQKQFDRYRKVAEKSPVLKSPYPELNNFISLVPMYHESLRILDCPGIYRAKSSDYWIAGWDCMTSSYATMYWGDVEQIKDMLRFFEETADKEKGIGHMFHNDNSIANYFALPAQGMYVSLLQLYYANSGDLNSVKERYPFAKTIFNSIAATEAGNTGFCKGSSLFPDFPVAMSETGNDLSAFNNTVFYCAARSMDYLAALTGDAEQQKKAQAIVHRFESNFLKLFFNPEKDFVVGSVDSKTFQQRDAYTIGSIRWENNYCQELTEAIDSRTINFFEKNCISKAGLREIPVWSKVFDMDANQLHCWWPVTGEYFMRTINKNNKKELVDQWVKWISYWTSHLSVPEGISFYIETDEPEFDRWTSNPGSWYGYSMRGWYQAAIHGVVGVDADAGGLTFHPYSGETMTLSGFNYMGKQFDIEMAGTGPYIESIEADGKIIKGTNKLPVDVYKDKQRISITVNRAAVNPYPVSVTTGTAIELQDYSYTNGTIKAMLSGVGLCRLKLNANQPPVVKLAGKKVHVAFNPLLNTASIELNLEPGQVKQIQIN